RRLADLPRRRRVHLVAVHGDGRARRALRRREPARQGEPRRLPGFPDGGDPRRRRARADRLDRIGLAAAARARLGPPARPRAASPDVRAAALPYLRTMFVCSIGQLLYFMIAGALRAAGDARTGMRIGMWIVGLNVGLNMILIRGFGPIPAFGAQGAALGTSIASAIASGVGIWMMATGRVVVNIAHGPRKPDWQIIRQLFPFGLPAALPSI